MNRVSIQIFIGIFILTGISACRKDKLHFQKVTKIESHTSSRLNKILFINDSTCIIGGGEKYLSAQVLRSVDGGFNFTIDSFPEAGKGLYGLCSSPNGNIYLSGFDGKLLHSADLGQSFQFTQLGNWKYHNSIAYPEDNKGLFVVRESYQQGYIVQVDSGYQITKTQSFNLGFNNIYMLNGQVGFTCGYGAVLKTTDGGNNWVFQDIKNDNFMAMHWVSESELWVCGYAGSIFHTTDGGANWKRQRNGNNITIANYALLDIRFKNSMDGWAVGEKGLVIYTHDGGEHWSQYDHFTESALRSIAFTPDGGIMVAGDDGSIYRLYTQ